MQNAQGTYISIHANFIYNQIWNTAFCRFVPKDGAQGKMPI